MPCEDSSALRGDRPPGLQCGRTIAPTTPTSGQPTPTMRDRDDHRDGPSTSSRSTRSGRSRSTASSRRTPGHPGAPMGAAPMAYTLWTRFLRHAPTHPDWPDRDRFVLSAGHASMLLYSLLHLTGYDVSLDDLEVVPPVGLEARPGHPEYGLTPGVEATTGPLGQGFANAVGMAIAERRLGGRVQPRRPRHRRPLDVHHLLRRRPPGGHRVGGGVSLAGHLRLRQARRPLRRQPHPARRADRDGLVARTSLARFEAYGWHAQRVEDGNDIEAIAAAIEEARADDRPSLIAVRTHIGYGSPNRQDTPEGARLAARARRGPARQGGLRLGSGQDVLRAGRGAASCSARRSRPARTSSRRGRRARRLRRRPSRTSRPSSAGGIAGRLPDGLGRGPQDLRGRRGGRDPEREPGRDPGPRGAAAASCSAARPTCPSRT